mgnify:CR=1 FL=1
MMSRTLDIIFSGIGLVVLIPLLVPLCILLRFTGEGQVFFVQKRVGRNEKVFGLIKFATMLLDSPNIGTGTLTVKNDPRILPIGNFLRKTKFNELPQMVCEKSESVDMMRVLEHGHKINLVFADVPCLTIDVPEDISPVEEALKDDSFYLTYRADS